MATFLHGCNYPWSTDGITVYYGLDFGANVWGSHLGVTTRRAAIARDFAAMAALGFVAVRWFVFGDGRAGIVYDGRDMPVGLDPHVFPDMDAALEIAGEFGIRLDLVLLDHRWMFDGVRQTIADPITGALLEARLPDGRARVLLSTGGREDLFDHVITPLVSRYGRSGARADLGPHILAFELMNEPDFVIEEWEADLSSHVARPLPFTAMAELVTRLSDTVHNHTSALSTIGCARARNLWAWDEDALGLDALQVHSYPDLRWPHETDVFGRSASQLGVRRDVILGEFPADAPRQHPPGAQPPSTTLADYLDFAVRGGYLGAWPWSFSGTDAYGRLPVAPLLQFAAQHPDLVNPRCEVPSAG